MRKNKYLFLLLLLLSCQPKTLTESEIFKQVFAEDKNKNAKIIFSKVGNFDLDAELEFFFIIRNGNEEILSIFKKDSSGFILVNKKIFTLIEMGAYRYNNNSKTWKADFNSSEEIHLLKNLQFHKFHSDSFESFSFEYLSEEPPLKLFSIPMIVRNYKTIFDGMEEFKESKSLEQKNRLDYKISAEKNQIQIENKTIELKIQ